MEHHLLAIAGFDGSGGAGMQADLKTISALGCYGMTVLTALPVQNTMGVREIYDIPPRCIQEQLEAIFDDIPVHALKIGMLFSAEIIALVAKHLRQHPLPHIVLDPVIVAKSGHRLLLKQSVEAIKRELFPLATVVTPNLMEASELLDREVRTQADMEQAAADLAQMGPKAVLLKGGHLDGNCDDCLYIRHPNEEIHWFSHARIPTRNTHGTGCTLSSALASFLAKGFPLPRAVECAKRYVTQAIAAGAHLHIGKGNGPVHHFHGEP